jgi:hypothetical protein
MAPESSVVPLLIMILVFFTFVGSGFVAGFFVGRAAGRREVDGRGGQTQR